MMNEGKTLRRRDGREDERAWPRVLAMLGGVLLLIIFGLLLLVYVVRKTHLGETGELRLTPAASVRSSAPQSFGDGWAGRGVPAAPRNVAPVHRDPAESEAMPLN